MFMKCVLLCSSGSQTETPWLVLKIIYFQQCNMVTVKCTNVYWYKEKELYRRKRFQSSTTCVRGQNILYCSYISMWARILSKRSLILLQDKDPKNTGSRRLSQTESQQQKGKDSSIFTPGRRKYITLSLQPTSPSPGKANTLANKKNTMSFLFSSFCHHAVAAFTHERHQHRSLHVRTEWTLPPSLIFSNIGMLNASIYITVKLHQNSFLKLTLEMPNCSHISYILDTRDTLNNLVVVIYT